MSVQKTKLVEHVCHASVITTQTDVSGQESVLDASLTLPASPASIAQMDISEMLSISSAMVSLINLPATW